MYMCVYTIVYFASVVNINLCIDEEIKNIYIDAAVTCRYGGKRKNGLKTSHCCGPSGDALSHSMQDPYKRQVGPGDYFNWLRIFYSFH